MYVIRDGGCNENTMVTEVAGAVDEDNKVSVTWKWPKLAELKLCVVFVLEENLSLEEILRRNLRGAVYEEEFGVRHIMELTRPCQMAKVFAAKRLPNRDLELVNQVSGNCSELFYRKVKLSYHVDYEREGFFSPKRRAEVRISGLSGLQEDYILYRCIGGTRKKFVYPIDVKKFGSIGSFIISLEKGEEVELELTEAQKKYITITRK